ncbi:ead/Ea22-like family protein [Raoultella ornithinolytica]|uniref:ead/Ea22-like family protein n=1 Tax=Raoultella ornithinolytica TaxID=54291 RepID=UPI001F23E170|nr:ead/Ea22-like family protein [Raoultella ornithinolytica]
MTDITELAQSLKAAAEKAGIEQWVNNRGEVNTADYEVDGGVYIDHICDCEIIGTESPQAEFIAMANPANILALVEALEKARRANGYLREQSAEWERKAISNFQECATMSERIYLLESRTVKLSKPKDSDPGWKIDPEFISKVQNAIGYDDKCECWEGTPSMEVVEAVLLAAAGIKMESE